MTDKIQADSSDTTYMNYLKMMGLIDVVILAMNDMGFSAIEIAQKTNVSRQTVYDIKKKNETIQKLLGSS